MRQKLVMPKLGLTMTEGVVAEWAVAPGESFAPDQTVLIVESDKALNDVDIGRSGVLLEIVQGNGATVPVGEVVGWYEDGLEASTEVAPATSAPLLTTRIDEAADRMGPPADPRTRSPSAARIFATPLARRLAARNGVDLAAVRGSGPRGRIKAADITAEAASRATEATGATLTTDPVPPEYDRHPKRATVRVAPTPTQSATAKRLTAAKQSVPHFYLARELDAGNLLRMHEELRGMVGPKITLTHFFIAALGRALRNDPQMNRLWGGDEIIELESSDVGVAVQTDAGLLVPIVRDAGATTLSQVARQTQTLVERARDRRLSAAEMAGGVVTVSNAGMFDVTYMTPIINPGQSMILGVGSVRRVYRPDALERPELRSEIGLVLACDHRIFDGVSGLRYLNSVLSLLEHPMKLWLE